MDTFKVSNCIVNDIGKIIDLVYFIQVKINIFTDTYCIKMYPISITYLFAIVKISYGLAYTALSRVSEDEDWCLAEAIPFERLIKMD